jgi:hypothetical protein
VLADTARNLRKTKPIHFQPGNHKPIAPGKLLEYSHDKLLAWHARAGK